MTWHLPSEAAFFVTPPLPALLFSSGTYPETPDFPYFWASSKPLALEKSFCNILSPGFFLHNCGGLHGFWAAALPGEKGNDAENSRRS